MIYIPKASRFFKIIFLSFLIVTVSCKKEDDGNVPNEEEQKEEPKEDIIPLPQISINTNGGIIVDEPKVNGVLTVSENDAVTFESAIGIEFRGASSQALFPKKSYGFETRDENNEDIDVSILGFPEEEDWILYAPYSDKTLMRNVLIYELSNEMNMYASRTKFVELTINDTYRGVYVFMEKLKRGGDRIDINKLKEDENEGEDVTGGYILKIDKIAGSNVGEGYNDENSFASSYFPRNSNSGQGIRFLYEYPKAEDITIEQKSYISDYMTDFEDALASDNFMDSSIGYESYIDVDSFIDFFILNELSNNVDGYRLSTFMHKEKNEKLKMGPIWDFNLGFGNADYCDGGSTNVWAYKFNYRCPNDYWHVPFWWERLLDDPTYVTKLKDRWLTLRGSTLSNTAILGKINDYNMALEDADAIDSNFETWDVLGDYVWPNSFVGNTYGDEIDHLKNWMESRLTWMDTQIEGL